MLRWARAAATSWSGVLAGRVRARFRPGGPEELREVLEPRKRESRDRDFRPTKSPMSISPSVVVEQILSPSRLRKREVLEVIEGVGLEV